MPSRNDATVLIGNTSGSSIVRGSPVVISGGSNVTVGASQNTLFIHGAAGGTAGGTWAGTNGAITGGSITVNTSGVSVNLPAYLTTAAQSNHSHGNPTLNLTNLSGTTASASNGFTLSLSAAAPGAGGGIAAAAGTQTQTSGTLAFVNSNGVSFGMSNSSQVTASHNGLTTARASNDAVGLNTAATQVTWTVNSAGISLNAGAYLTTAQPPGAYLTTARASNDAVGLNTAGTSVTWTVNSSGISLNAGAYLTTAANSTHSHGNPTLALTNLSGTTASASNGLTLSLSAAAPGGGAAQTFSAGTASGSANPVYFSNANGVSFGLGTGASSSVITASVNAGGGVAPFRRYIEIMNGERFTTIANLSQTNLSNRVLLFPFWLDGTDLTPNTVRFMITGIASSNRSLGGTYDMGLYSLANDTQAQLWASDRITLSITASSQSTVWNGFRALDFTGLSGSTMTNEGRWILALRISNVSNNATWANAAIYGGDPMPAFSGYMINGTSASTNASQQIFPFWGAYSATTGAFPGTINLTQVNGMASASNLDVYAVIKKI